MATDWFKMGVGYYRDPALIRAGEAAELFFIRAIAFCAENDTRGHIPKEAVALICPRKPTSRIAKLIAEKLVVEHKNDFEIRSWDKWQEELDALQERRRKDAERKRFERKQGRASAGQSPDIGADIHGTDLGPSAESPHILSCSLDGDGDGEKSKKTSRARATPVPDIFAVTDPMREWIADHRISPDQAKRETERFLDYHRAKGSKFLDWTAAWRNWMGKVTPDGGGSYASKTQGQILNEQMGLS